MNSELRDLFVATTPGLEPITRDEIRQLLPTVPLHVEPGGIALSGSLGHAFSLNLQLRTASRVLLRLARFRAAHFSELERHARSVPWHEVAAEGRGLEFAITSRKSRLYHTGAIAERLATAARRAIPGMPEPAAPPLRSSTDPAGIPPVAVDPAAPTRIVVRIVRDRVTISADTSGEHLHVRGPRVATGIAPLRETIAAALLLASGWDRTSPLLDPMCGSGTIALEAAAMARDRAAGIARPFALEQWPGFDTAAATALRDEARGREHDASAPILATDHAVAAVQMARANAVSAGVDETIDFAVAAIGALDPDHTQRRRGAPPREDPQGGFIVTNPPWGLRLGDESSLQNLYAALGRLAGAANPAASVPQWRLALITPSARLATAADPGLDCRFEFRQGGVNLGLWVR
jgi:putative N6-adenine-specific DNA methylase